MHICESVLKRWVLCPRLPGWRREGAGEPVVFPLISSPCVGADEEKIDGGDGERRQKKILSIGKIPTEDVWRVSEEQPLTPAPSGAMSVSGVLSHWP